MVALKNSNVFYKTTKKIHSILSKKAKRICLKWLPQSKNFIVAENMK